MTVIFLSALLLLTLSAVTLAIVVLIDPILSIGTSLIDFMSNLPKNEMTTSLFWDELNRGLNFFKIFFTIWFIVGAVIITFFAVSYVIVHSDVIIVKPMVSLYSKGVEWAKTKGYCKEINFK